ncbi:DUF2218 domain-containing protein [Actinoplanes solisilvae]|uniref:DUF2218 domain-containing protein n=1 Tax=Actinoplanes solisilvae TaxID=2486853 RepID=UPI000FD8B451|nr:DUF2218 domain-containing protein [Actinoplanes solisilvae]
MPTAEARIRTDRPGRDLIELSKSLGGHLCLRPDAHATFDVDGAQCTLRTGPGALTVCVESPDREELRRAQRHLAWKLRRARDLPEVTWRQVEDTAPRFRAVLGLLAMVTLVVLLTRPWNDVF